MLLIDLTIGPMSAVGYSALSRTQHDRKMFEKTLEVISDCSALLIFPAFAGLLVTGDLLLPLMFGERWEPAARLVPYMSAVGPAIFWYLIVSIALFASGRMDRMLLLGASGVWAHLAFWRCGRTISWTRRISSGWCSTTLCHDALRMALAQTGCRRQPSNAVGECRTRSVGVRRHGSRRWSDENFARQFAQPVKLDCVPYSGRSRGLCTVVALVRETSMARTFRTPASNWSAFTEFARLTRTIVKGALKHSASHLSTKAVGY